MLDSNCQITVYGAACEVTGSCYLLETEQARLLVDCGLFQGPERLTKLNHIPSTILAKPLDAVLLTHGHLDHCGRLPLLVRAGYRGPIYATQGTIDIATLILFDAAKIQQDDAARENRRRQRHKLQPISPMFSHRDIERVCKLFEPVEYEQSKYVASGICAEFVEAGHILGSASIKLKVMSEPKETRIVFSGDLGPWDVPIMRDPAVINRADLVFMESTYGDRDHRSLKDTIDEFNDVLNEALENNGKVFIPTFAVGRAQQILYHIANFFANSNREPCPIYLDSPMAIAATQLYNQHPELLDSDAQILGKKGQLRTALRSLRLSSTADESKALNNVAGPCIILAGAGMCNAGRILHHLRQNLPFPETKVIIVGYQVKGSLGRRLLEGAETVKVLGETVHVRATIKSLGGFSAHAGQSDLLRWIGPMANKKARIILTHGESHPMNELAAKIEERFGLKPERPKLGSTIWMESESAPCVKLA